MRYNVTVDIPYEKILPYTLYAQGYISDMKKDENEDFVHIKFLGGTVFILFYTFEKFRRAYVVTGHNPGDLNSITLPGINSKLYMIYCAKGRKIDHLKRVLFLLTQDDEYLVYQLPLEFWFKLCFNIQFFSGYKSDVIQLFNQFKELTYDNT